MFVTRSLFFNGKLGIEDIYKYLVSSNLTAEEVFLFYVRMLFPSFYFDLYEGIIGGVIEEKELLKITSRIEDYQVLLKDLYWIVRNYAKLPDIEWIIKT